ncbi:hypothetical protein RFI_27731, partial [Reticulomyxa filosa]
NSSNNGNNTVSYQVSLSTLAQYCEHVCHVISAILFHDNQAALALYLFQLFLRYGAFHQIILWFRFWVYLLGLCQHPDDDDNNNNNNNNDTAAAAAAAAADKLNRIKVIQQQIKTIFIRSHEFDDVQVLMDLHQDQVLYQHILSVVTQLVHFFQLLANTHNIADVDPHFRYYICVEVTSLWKSPWFCNRRQPFTFKDFTLIHKGFFC